MEKQRRIHLIDELRGLCIILVVIYHAFYSLVMIYGYKQPAEAFAVMRKIQPVLPAMFILLSGISFQLSRSNIRRGLKLLAVAAIMMLALWLVMPSQMIWFGIIHFLAVMNIVLGLLKKYVDKIPASVGIISCAILFILTYNVQNGYIGIESSLSLELPEFMYLTDLTAPLGFYSPSFHSADYCPIIPWAFMFIIGTVLGRYVRLLPEKLSKTHIKPLAFIGRHTLIIYLLHQPIIVGVLQLIETIR